MTTENKTYIVQLKTVRLSEDATRKEKIDHSTKNTEMHKDRIIKELSETGLLNEPLAIKTAGAMGCLIINCNEGVINSIKEMDCTNSVLEDTKYTIDHKPSRKKPNGFKR